MDGSFISNELYIGQRLLFSQDQPQATAAFLDIAGDELWRTMKAAWFKGFVFALTATPLALLIASAGSDAWGLAVLLWLVAWAVPWFLRDHLYAGHWELLLEDQADVTESVFALAYQHLMDKGSPAVLRPRRLVSVIGGESRYYLTATQGHYVAYIAVMPYGKDLFVSWTMWRELFPVALFLRWLGERLSALVGKGSTFHQIVRSDPARAMREAVHNATRAGAELAVKGNRATVHGTFGTTLPQETIDDRIALASAGWPTMPPTPAAAPAGQWQNVGTGTYPVPYGHGAQPSAPPLAGTSADHAEDQPDGGTGDA